MMRPAKLSLGIGTPPATFTPNMNLGSYAVGAVLMGPGSLIAGQCTFPAAYARGVISFWADYDSSASPSGDSAKILHLFGDASKNTTTLAPPTPIGCVGVFLNAGSVDLYLRDGFTGLPLLKASGPPPAIGWHHYICSWDASELVGPLPITPPTIQILNPAPSGTVSVDTSNPPNGKLVCALSQGNGSFGPGPGTLSGVPPGTEIDFNTNSHLGPYTISRSASGNVVSFSATDGNGVSIGQGMYDISGMQWTTPLQPGAVYTPGTVGNDLPVFFPNPGNTFDVTLIHVVPNTGSQVIEAQWAMDRGGGPVVGGPVMDTSAQDVGSTSQPMTRLNTEFSTTGVLLTNGTNPGGDADGWVIKAPADASCKWAYCYFGIPRSGFFDLTNPASLNYFISPQLTPQNLGFQGSNVSPIACEWMHTGTVGYFTLNDAGDLTTTSAIQRADWTVAGFPLVSTTPPIESGA